MHGGNYLAALAAGSQLGPRFQDDDYPFGFAHSERMYYARGADGRFASGLTAVAFELEDTTCNNGGFGCLPGSHRMGLPPPVAMSAHVITGVVDGRMQRVPAKAGDAIIVS